VRPPEVFVRPLAHEKAVALKRRAKQAKHFATRERAAILLASNVGTAVPQIAQMWMTDESHVRRVIHDFNQRGKSSPGTWCKTSTRRSSVRIVAAQAAWSWAVSSLFSVSMSWPEPVRTRETDSAER
jgi:hypothetical protein